jgi:hypothetical protein
VEGAGDAECGRDSFLLQSHDVGGYLTGLHATHKIAGQAIPTSRWTDVHYTLFWECEFALKKQAKGTKVIRGDEKFFDKMLNAVTGRKK